MSRKPALKVCCQPSQENWYCPTHLHYINIHPNKLFLEQACLDQEGRTANLYHFQAVILCSLRASFPSPSLLCFPCSLSGIYLLDCNSNILLKPPAEKCKIHPSRPITYKMKCKLPAQPSTSTASHHSLTPPFSMATQMSLIPCLFWNLDSSCCLSAWEILCHIAMASASPLANTWI